MTFIELRAHTAFSFGDGAVTPEALVQCAAVLGYPALGITDTADFGGIPRFVLEARRRGVRPIVGAELEVDGRPAAFLVLDDVGYRNLAGLVTRARVGDLATWDRERPHTTRGRAGVTWTDVAERSEGLFMLTGPHAGELGALLEAGEPERAARVLARWREAFGDRIAVEVQWHRTGRREAMLVDALIALAERERTPWAVSVNPRYVDGTGRLVHDMLTALRAERTLDEAAQAGLLLPNGSWRLAAPDEIAREWAGRPEGLAETERIADLCRIDLKWMRPPLPHFAVGEGYDDDSYLRHRVLEGARERWGEPLTESQMRQIEHELAVIRRLGFSGFFLVMWGIVRRARDLNILCQGRGSAANSAVAYCLGITAVDPVANGLLFERFLSETRVDGQNEAPDIDLDIEHDRREELLDFVYGEYARAGSAIACIVQHYRAPNALLDAARALGYPPDLAHQLSKRLHYHEAAEGAEAAKELAPRFGLDVEDVRGRTLLRLMRGCDGLPRMRSTHVGGFVLSSAPLGDYLPVEHTAMGRTIIQFDKDDLDSLGVPKFDLLGLGGLSLVRRAFDIVERRTGERPRMYRLPKDDPDTYAMISRGETVGTFQIESRAQIASILNTRPERIYDLVVQVALIRPGPILAKFVHPYTRRRRGTEPVSYRHPGLEPILERTQGIPIFQEQAMAIAMTLGGCSAAEADALRRAMGHRRKVAKLNAVLDHLEERIAANGIDPGLAHEIRHDLESFGNYGFPESHAWSFALIAYATSWLKCHHPAAFYAGILNAWPMGFYHPSTLVREARRQGVEVRPPCLRDGERECTVEETGDPARPALRIGWRYVRGIGERMLDALSAAYAGGAFGGIEDVVRRSGLTRADALHLAQAGAFAAWEPDRRKAAWRALHAVGDSLPLAPVPPPDHDPRQLELDELIYLDYHATGMSLNGHPMELIRDRLRRGGALDSRDLLELTGRQQVIVGGLVMIRQRPESANGTIFLLLEDEHGVINVIVPAKKVEEYAEIVKYAPFVLVLGRFERDGEVRNVVGERFKEIEAPRLTHSSRDFR